MKPQPADRTLAADPGDSRVDRLLGAAVLGLFLLVFIAPLGQRPLFSPDETRYGEIPREMLVTGDWVVPRLNGMRYFEKPPLGYWANAVSLRLLGENPFAVRLSGTLAAGLTALLVYLFTRRITGRRRTAVLAAAVYLTFALVYTVATVSVLDNLLTLCITAGILAFYHAVTESSRARQRGYAVLSGVALGGAFLTKGFLGFVVPGIVLLPWLIWTGQLKAGLERTWMVAVTALLVALPWAVLIHLRESDFWHYFFWEEHVRRFMADNAQHKQSPLYFVAFLPLLAFPWIGLLPAAVAGSQTGGAPATERDGARLLWLWVLLPFAFFSASSGKLITYILPCFPPLAAVIACGLVSYLSAGRRLLVDVGLGLIAAVLGVAFAVVVYDQAGGRFVWQAGEEHRALLVCAALFLGAAFAAAALRSHHPQLKLLACVASFVPLLAVAQFAMPDRLLASKSPGILLAPHAARLPRDTILFSNSGIVRALAWYFKREDIYMTVEAGELQYGLGYPDARARYLDGEAFAALLASDAGRHDVVVACKRDCGDDYESRMPATAQRYEHGHYRLWHIPRTSAAQARE